MTKLGYKKPFGLYKDVQANEEIVKKDGWEQGSLILTYFDIYNVGINTIRLRINESNELITLAPNEGFGMLEHEVYSCICMDEGTIQVSGLY